MVIHSISKTAISGWIDNKKRQQISKGREAACGQLFRFCRHKQCRDEEAAVNDQ
jgi:hypothetical protein